MVSKKPEIRVCGKMKDKDAVRLIKKQMKKGFVNGWEFDLSLLAMALSVFFTGPGTWILF